MSLKRTLAVGTLAAAFALTAVVPATYAWSISDWFGGNKSKVEQTQTSDSGSFGWMHDRGDSKRGKSENRREKGFDNEDGMMGGKAGGMMGNQPAASAEMQTLLDQLKTARENNDTAKVTELREKIKAQHTADQTARETALDTAIAGGYATWKTYATAQKFPQTLLDKVTADNFTTYAELVTTHKKVRELTEKLGLSMGGAMMGGGVGMPMMGGNSGNAGGMMTR